MQNHDLQSDTSTSIIQTPDTMSSAKEMINFIARRAGHDLDMRFENFFQKL
jgi:hypothetical protein